MRYYLLISYFLSTSLMAQEPQVNLSTAPDVDSTVNTNVFIYDPTGKRDPFQAESEIPKEETTQSATAKTAEQSTSIPKRGLEALEFFDLSQLKVTAIIWNTKKPRAMVVDPNGVMHTVKIKTRIGQRNGFVVAIREGEIVVVEYIQQDGNWTKTFNVLHLR